jgi:phospholipid transport system substrate-binding protein
MLKRNFLAQVLFAVMLVPAMAFADANAQRPEDVIQQATASLRGELEGVSAQLREDSALMLGLVQRHVAPHVDFERIARRVVGKQWTDASTAQRQRLVTELRTMMFRAYSNAIGGLVDSAIEYGESKRSRSGKTAMVPTTVVRAATQRLSMKYYLYHSDAGWRLFDIAVEGVSMLRIYKSTFKSRMDNDGLDGLIEHLVAANLTHG